MNKKDDYILMLVAILLLILSGGVIFWFSIAKKPNTVVFQPFMPKIIGEAKLIINFGNGNERNFEGEIIEGETLVGVLIQASKAGDFSYKLDGKNNLAAVENFAAQAGKSWHWYVNDKKIDKSLYEIILKDGDNILIKYESR